ncbi:MAG: 30S ribosomal protein S16, partial [SAR324 cluster bacterium]|nr:30S ribosomal protein S16 [SAR324 cluster bacterium]
LARGGAKKSPYYHVVVIDSHKKREGLYIEKIGFYNPMVQENRCSIDADRVKHWISVGAQPTERVKKLMKNLNIEVA